MSTIGNMVDQEDMDAIRRFCHYLAEEWWKSQLDEQAVCDVCNGPISKGGGFLIGSSLYCGSCASEQFGAEGLTRLRADPNFFGRGLLEKARSFAVN